MNVIGITANSISYLFFMFLLIVYCVKKKQINEENRIYKFLKSRRNVDLSQWKVERKNPKEYHKWKL